MNLRVSGNSFEYENLVTFVMAARSIFVLNWFQNLGQSVSAPLNFIMTGFGSFVWVLDSFSYFFVDSSCAFFSIFSFYPIRISFLVPFVVLVVGTQIFALLASCVVFPPGLRV